MNLPRNRLFWAVGLGHMTNDIFMSMGPVLLAFLSVSILPMTNTQIGLTVSATQLLGAVTQPGFGWMADRNGGRWLAAGGVAWTVSFMMLALVGAQTGYFWLMFIPYVMRAMGSGAFHPSGAMHAADSDKLRAASNLSYFFLLGQTGLALGPVLAGIVLDASNISTTALFTAHFSSVYDELFQWGSTIAPVFALSIIAIPGVLFMAMSLPTASIYNAARIVDTPEEAEAKAKARLKLPWRALSILLVLVVLRSLAQPGSVTFIPVLFQNKGWSPSEYGAITSIFWIASGFAGVFFGNLADRFDRRLIIAGSMVSAAPAFFLLPLVDGPLAFAMAVAAGGLSGGSHSIIVVLAQELIPAAKGFASGAILGIMFGTGAIGNAMIGILSDSIGLGSTFQLVALLIIVAGVMAFALPGRKTPPPLAAPVENIEAKPAGAD